MTAFKVIVNGDLLDGRCGELAVWSDRPSLHMVFPPLPALACEGTFVVTSGDTHDISTVVTSSTASSTLHLHAPSAHVVFRPRARKLDTTQEATLRSALFHLKRWKVLS